MAIPLQKLCLVVIWVFIVFVCSSYPSLSHRFMSNGCLFHESEALLSFKAALNGSQGYLSSWVNGTDCCSMWHGISCNNHTNHVVSLDVYLLTEDDHTRAVISQSLCQLHFLTSLTMTGGVRGTLPSCFSNLTYIQYLHLSDNKLSGTIPSSICSLTRLAYLDLGTNEFNGSIPSCLGNLSSLYLFWLSANHLSGSIPTSLGNLSSLEYFSVFSNELSGNIPDSLCTISSLVQLFLSDNQLTGNIPNSLGNLTLLSSLLLGGNPLSGNIPNSLGNLSLLTYLFLEETQLSGTIPPSFAQLSSLTLLYVSGNRFNETVASSSLPPSLVRLELSLNHNQSISETFFQNLTNLDSLYLSNCILNVSKTWIPSFHLTELSLVSCLINDEIPPWISTLFSLETLELGNNGLMGEIPSWLWKTDPLLQNLNLSGNHLEGALISNTSVWMQLVILDVSRNALSGHIPSIWSSNMTNLLLNDNLFSGNIPSSFGRMSQLLLLNLANNNLSGTIPPSLSNCSAISVINLGNNNLEGRLPHEFSKLSELYSLVVHNNKLNGSFPYSIVNCSKLQVLDIGKNLFGGEVPKSVGNLSKLRVLVMNENNLTGSIPSEIGQLRSLQILLLSSNHISGAIPNTILSLQAMANENQDGFVLSSSDVSYRDGLSMTLKGTKRYYEYILSTLTSIDLSNNELEGEVPFDIGNLKGLRILNLSVNNLISSIPNSLGEMSQLESLDLSRNQFSGKIPIEIESLNFLGSLNLSNNNLSGLIPQGQHIVSTFGESSFSDNPYLWGCPLPKNCSLLQFAPPPPPIVVNKEKLSSKYLWYKISVGLSYGVAFGGMLSLILIRLSWKRKYFSKVDKILKLLFPWMRNLTL